MNIYVVVLIVPDAGREPVGVYGPFVTEELAQEFIDKHKDQFDKDHSYWFPSINFVFSDYVIDL